MNAHPKSTTGVSIPALDGLRGVAILSVILHHCFYLPPNAPFSSEINGWMQAGRLGVGIFFVLSGFLMGLVVFRTNREFRMGHYLRNRFARIYPAFLLSLILAAIASLILQKPLGAVLESCLLYLTTQANWIPVPLSINDVYWSLLVEIHFYLLLPLIYFALRRLTRHASVITCLAFALVPVMLRGWQYTTLPDGMLGWTGFRIVFPERMDAFALGLIFSTIFLNASNRPNGDSRNHRLCSAGVAMTVMAFVAYGATFVFSDLAMMHREALFLEGAYLLVQLGVFCLLWVSFDPGGVLARWLTQPWLTFCGLISYEWYLIHYPILKLCQELLPSGSVVGYLGKVLIPSLGGFLFSILIYYCFSRPLQNWIRGARGDS